MARKLLENAAFFNRTNDIVRDDDGTILGFRERGSERGGRFNLVPVDAQGESIDVELARSVVDEESAYDFLLGSARPSRLSSAGNDILQSVISLGNQRGISTLNRGNFGRGGIGASSARARALAPLLLEVVSGQRETLSRLEGMGFNLVKPSSQVPVFYPGVGLVDETLDLSRADVASLESNDPFIKERIDIESELSELRAEREKRLQRRRDADNPTGQRGLLSGSSRNQGRNLLSA